MADLFDREEAIKVISNDSLDVKCFCVIGRGQENRKLAKIINNYVDLLLETAKRKILSLPKANTKRHAHWGIWDEDTNTYECSNCKNPFTLLEGTPEQNTYFYCPYCGCRTDEVTQ